MFIWNENELNQEQTEAVNYDGNILLIACPGSGKTRTLTYKTACELTKLSDSRQFIIAITYTNRAADEIKERVELLGVDSKQLWIGTIHSFCLEWILRPYSLYMPQLRYGFRLIEDHDSEEIITELCIDYNLENNLTRKDRITYWDCGYIATSKPGYKITATLSSSKLEAVKTILKKYHGTLEDNNQIDFEQILYYSLKLLQNYSTICKTLSRLFPFILIDEYQDTKEIQYHIISSILKAGERRSRLFIVGDPNQSIYQNLGGYPIEREELMELTGLDIKHVELARNYRSSSKIISYFHHFKTFDSRIEAHGDDAEHIGCITYDYTIDNEILIERIACLIEKNINEYKIIPENICVLAPWWIHVASVAKKLMLKLPAYSFDGPGMAPFARSIENFWFKLSRIVLTAPSPDLYVKRARWAYDVLADLENIGVNTSGMSKNKLLKICNSTECDDHEGLSYLANMFAEIFNQLEINFTQYPFLVEHSRSFFESARKRIDRLKKEGFSHIGDTESFKKIFQQRNGITVSSCHGIKGAEFDTVIAFSLLENCIPHFSDKNGRDNAKKLLYVITSRARKNIHLISECGKYNAYKKEYQPTEVLREYDYEYDLL